MWDFMERMIMLAYGLVIAGGLLGFMYWRHGWRWRLIQTAFPDPGQKPIRNWHIQTIYCRTQRNRFHKAAEKLCLPGRFTSENSGDE